MTHFICQVVFSEMKRTTQCENNNSNFNSEKDNNHSSYQGCHTKSAIVNIKHVVIGNRWNLQERVH